MASFQNVSSKMQLDFTPSTGDKFTITINGIKPNILANNFARVAGSFCDLIDCDETADAYHIPKRVLVG